MHSFRSTVLQTLIQEKLDTQIIHNWYFRRRHICHAQDEFAKSINDKSLQLEFSTQSSCGFWIRTINGCLVISDVAIHNLVAFCTTCLCEAAFSKVIIIKSKNQSFVKNIENILHPALFCINLRIDNLCKNHRRPCLECYNAQMVCSNFL